jgi:hypothetical protein
LGLIIEDGFQFSVFSFQKMMDASRIYADFQNCDEQGRLRLNCAGTTEDLARLGISLAEGAVLTLYCEELEVQGRVVFSEEENIWVAAIDWSAIHTDSIRG